MARSKEQIKQDWIAKFVEIAAERGLEVVPNNWSETDYKDLTADTIATTQAIEEQRFDSYVQDVKDASLILAPQTPAWFQDKMLNLFEYDAVAVPIVQLGLDPVTNSYLIPYYPNPNPAFRVVKYCSVVPGGLGTVTIKIAGVGPSQITGLVLDAAQSFINTIKFPGITYNVTSGISDKLFMQLDVYYNGLYSAIIQTKVIEAIDTYLAGIKFNGNVVLSDLYVAIKAVAGVNDVVFNNIKARDNATVIASATDMILNNTWIQEVWSTVAGYIIKEDTAGFLLTDARVADPSIKNLNLIPQ